MVRYKKYEDYIVTWGTWMGVAATATLVGLAGGTAPEGGRWAPLGMLLEPSSAWTNVPLAIAMGDGDVPRPWSPDVLASASWSLQVEYKQIHALTDWLTDIPLCHDVDPVMDVFSPDIGRRSARSLQSCPLCHRLQWKVSNLRWLGPCPHQFVLDHTPKVLQVFARSRLQTYDCILICMHTFFIATVHVTVLHAQLKYLSENK